MPENIRKSRRSAVGSAHGSGPWGRGFKSRRLDHLCSTKKLQNTKSTRFSRSCAFLLLYLVFYALRGIFEFKSCILTCFLKNRTRTDDFVLIPAWHPQFNTNLSRENKDKCSLFFYAVLRGDFLFTVKKIIIKTVNRKEFSMKYKDWLDVWFAN